jgi:hypothetical protein
VLLVGHNQLEWRTGCSTAIKAILSQIQILRRYVQYKQTAFSHTVFVAGVQRANKNMEIKKVKSGKKSSSFPKACVTVKKAACFT